MPKTVGGGFGVGARGPHIWNSYLCLPKSLCTRGAVNQAVPMAIRGMCWGLLSSAHPSPPHRPKKVISQNEKKSQQFCQCLPSFLPPFLATVCGHSKPLTDPPHPPPPPTRCARCRPSWRRSGRTVRSSVMRASRS